MPKIVFNTESENSHFFGFHDISPWNKTEEYILFHQTTKDDIKFRTKEDFINVGIYNFRTKQYHIIDKTNSWNWQQGSRLQWIDDFKIIYNTSDKDKIISKIYDVKTKEFEQLNFPIYSYNNNSKLALTYNFHRLSKYWKGYGYVSGNFLKIDSNEVELPNDDGIFIYDFKAKQIKLLLSFTDIFNASDKSVKKDIPRFVTHTTFNKSGTKFAFFERFHTNEGALYSRFYVYDFKSKKLSFVGEGKFSHFDWKTDNEIMIWSRSSKSVMTKMSKKGLFKLPILKQSIKLIRKLNPNIKSKITNEYYRLYNVKAFPKLISSIGKDLITSDGHPMFSETDNNIFVNDTYPDLDHKQELMLFDIKRNKRINLMKFSVPEKFLDLDLKCDLHPRFNHKGNLVCIDSAHSGKRQMYIIEL